MYDKQIYDKALLENCETLKSAPDCYKNQPLCSWQLLKITLMHQNLFLNAIRPKKSVIKHVIGFFCI